MNSSPEIRQLFESRRIERPRYQYGVDMRMQHSELALPIGQA